MNEQLKEAIRDTIHDALGGALDCNRVWSAWGVGTMSEDDFSQVADDPSRVEEITDAVMAVLAAKKLVCETCSGWGRIGGPSFYAPDEGGEPCPDCNACQAVDLGAGVQAIANERKRQLQAEGFTREGDQQYRRGELAKAATAYVQLAAMDLEAGTRDHIAWHGPAAVWPWAREWWKPVDARRDLVRAGALIAAQIDLIDSGLLKR